MDFIERPELGLLATFVPNKTLPVYNWLYYKEGFARDLVWKLLEEMKVQKNARVLDLFCGVGTTLLACREKGISAVGFDVSPVAVFAAQVKTRKYNVKELQEARTKLIAVPFERRPVQWKLAVAKKAFSIYAREDIEFLKHCIDKLFAGNKEIRDFFWLALIQTATKCTFAEKHGGSIKINKKRHQPPFRKLFSHVTKTMIKDVEAVQGAGSEKLTAVETRAHYGDARKLGLEDKSIDAIITSPPYLNKIEYANVYAIEQELFFGGVSSRPAVKSFIEEHAGEETDDVFEGAHTLPLVARAYFKDMKQVLAEMYRVLKPRGKAAIVVGNGCFPEGVVESDALLAELAENIGFEVKSIAVLSKRWCMRNRTEKVALMNESLLLLEKP